MKYAFNQKGFTLSETIIAVLIIASLMIILTNLLSIMRGVEIDHYQQMEVMLASQEISHDLYQANKMSIDNESLFLKTPQGSVTYKTNNNRLIRQVNNEGYQIVLHNVLSIKWTIKDDQLFLQVNFIKGGNYQVHIGIEP